MARSISVNYCIYYLFCVCMFWILNNGVFLIDRKVQQTTAELSPSFSWNKTKDQSVVRFFQRKENTMKRSSWRTVLPNAFPKTSNKPSFLIYEYTRRRPFCQRSNSASIYMSTCPFRNCHFTCDAALVRQSDAVLMLYSQLNYEKLHAWQVHRHPDQRWLLWNDEPYAPSAIYNRFLFNWTISYRSDSEVSLAAYGITLRRNIPVHRTDFNIWIEENYGKRQNKALWFVSNCKAKERLRYYEQLKEHFLVAVSGKCLVNRSEPCARGSRCEIEMLSTMKFYLAFESTTSRRDYITEKFWRSFSYGLIPIVIGPKRADYERIAPPNSFIYANDFTDARTLGKHLNNIATNRRAYENYHRWRLNYETRHQGDDVEQYRFCELCYKLNTNRDRSWYSNINEFFLEKD